jgi:hypothetical protein
VALRQPNIRWSRWVILISALGHLDRVEDAAQAIDARHRLNPEIDLAFVEDTENVVNAHTPSWAYLMDGMRKAGMQ